MAEVPVQPQPTSQGINWKTILIGAVIGGLVVGIGALGFYLYQGSSEDTTPTQVTTPKKATDSAKQATPSAKEDTKETNLTESYTDSFYKVSFNYLDSWDEKTESGISACEPSVGPKNAASSGISICEFGQSSVDELANLPGSSASMKKNLIVSGKSAIRQVVTENGEDKVYAYVGDVSFNDQVGTLTIVGWPKDSGLTTSEFIDLFDKILSTFKFLD